MPSRNTVRTYTDNAFYHVYNRGVEKRIIFLDDTDYKIFMYYLFIYLADPTIIAKTYPRLKNSLKKGNFYKRITLHAYVLMPNHFHLLLHQSEKSNLSQFMKQVTNAYTRYFNQRYVRVGGLFQGVFKAVYIDNDTYLLHISRYIHRNPLSFPNINLSTYPWSSYKFYLYLQHSTYINTEYILNFFSKYSSRLNYQSFVEYAQDMIQLETLE